MEVRLITTTGAELRPLEDLARLLGSGAGFVWADIGEWDDAAEHVLTDIFRFNPMAIRDCSQRNQVPKVHVYADHVFVVLHAPQAGRAGHVHYIELDQFIGTNYLVTVHGPVNPAVDPTATRVEVDAVVHRLVDGRLHPATPLDLSYAVVSALTGRLRTFTATLTKDVWRLEQQVTAGHLGDPEQFQEDMFRVRHGLLTVQTMCSLSQQVYGRMGAIAALGQRGQQQIDDLVDQFQRLAVMADGQKDYLQGTIDFYQTRTNTKMTIAAERLAVIAAVTLPVTALSSILGMNVIVNESTQVPELAILLAVMLVMSVLLLIWTKRLGWW